MSRKELSWLVVALALAFTLGAWLRWSALPGQETGDNQTVIALLADHTAPSQGPADASVTMVLFTDYQCPACRLSDGAMRHALAEDPDVRLVYRDLPVFGPESEAAARVALAARYQGLYAPVHAALMRGPARTDAMARRRAVEQAGGNWARLQADLATHRAAIEAELARTRHDAMTIGARGTPTYLIGRRRIEGALSQRQFARAFATARDEAR